MAKSRCATFFDRNAGDSVLFSSLDDFLRQVQRKAFVQAEFAVRQREEALDIVQDAMLKLASSYAERDSTEWPKLFQRILQNQIKDWYRRSQVRSVLFFWEQHEQAEDSAEWLATDDTAPSDCAESERRFAMISKRIRALPLRQQQVFLLRAYWGHSVAEVAEILGCHSGTVKTHYARALHALQSDLESIKC